MATAIESIREKLHHYIEVAEEDKLCAIYTLVETEINQELEDEIYSENFKKELDARLEAYKNGGIVFTEEEVMKSVRQKLIK